MINGTKKVLDQISEFKVHNITEKHILKILKLQELVREYNNDADND